MDIIKSLSSSYCISSRKIFAAGKSNGGGLTNLLACDPKASSIIAAFAPVAGAYYLTKAGKPPTCSPSRLTPILEFHGFQDETAPYAGGNNTRDNGFLPSIPAWVDDWATRDGCVPGRNKTTVLCGEGSKKITRYNWDCQGVLDAVVHYNFTNLKHVWPSREGNDDGDRTTCYDATPLIMDWFSKHVLP